MGNLRERIGELTLLLPGDPRTLTGGYIYDGHIVEGLRRIGWHVDVCSLDDSFPRPTASALDHARDVLRNIPDRRLVVIDGLALGGFSKLLQAESARLRFIALIHHPLALETGLDATARRDLGESERDSLVFVPRVIVTSNWTSRALADYGVAEDRISVVEPGVDVVTTARQAELRGRSTSLTLLSVASLTPRKGHAVLFDALARICNRKWQLRCVGSMSRDPATAEVLRQQIQRLQLGERIRLLGEVDATTLQREYDDADVFVLASYLEGYGMALAEAVGHGLPIVSTAAGAVPETVSAKVGLLVTAGNDRALAEAIAKVLDEPDTRQQLAINALTARKELPTWRLSSQRFAAALEKPW